tara:strand:+ start:3276 stop:3518 length:243 start_codon:yes stop_codon:yes gene_type:complete
MYSPQLFFAISKAAAKVYLLKGGIKKKTIIFSCADCNLLIVSLIIAQNKILKDPFGKGIIMLLLIFGPRINKYLVKEIWN